MSKGKLVFWFLKLQDETNTYDQTKGSSAFGIDEEEGWDSENDLDSTVAKRGVQSLGVGIANIREDGGAIERDD